MNPTIKKEWVAALRSGEYEQGTGYLRSGNEFCCLGVLCDIALRKGIVYMWRNLGYTYFGTDSNSSYLQLPAPVVRWAELDAADPRIEDHQALSYYNDTAGYSFDEIADLIEEKL